MEILNEKSIRTNEFPRLPQHFYEMHTKKVGNLFGNYTPIMWIPIALYLLNYYVLHIAFMTSVTHVITALVFIFFIVRYRELKKEINKNTEVTIKAFDGSPFSVEFINTQRYRFKVTKDASIPCEISSSDTVSCIAVYLLYEVNKGYSWVFVEENRPWLDGFCVQVTPFGIINKRNRIWTVNYQREMRLSIQGRHHFNAKTHYPGIIGKDDYSFNLLLPYKKFSTGSIVASIKSNHFSES